MDPVPRFHWYRPWFESSLAKWFGSSDTRMILVHKRFNVDFDVRPVYEASCEWFHPIDSGMSSVELSESQLDRRTWHSPGSLGDPLVGRNTDEQLGFGPRSLCSVSRYWCSLLHLAWPGRLEFPWWSFPMLQANWRWGRRELHSLRFPSGEQQYRISRSACCERSSTVIVGQRIQNLPLGRTWCGNRTATSLASSAGDDWLCRCEFLSCCRKSWEAACGRSTAWIWDRKPYCGYGWLQTPTRSLPF